MSTSLIIEIESRSARISGALDLRPDLSTIWHQVIAFGEAAATLSMEGVGINPSDLLQQFSPDLDSEADRQSILTAIEVKKVMLTFDDIAKNPGREFDRALAAGKSTALTDIHLGGRASYSKHKSDTHWEYARTKFVESIPRILRHQGTTFLPAIAVARLLRSISPEPSPIAERLLFMSTEHQLRKNLLLDDTIIYADYRQSQQIGRANWTMTPAIALTRGGFRSWNPDYGPNFELIMERINKQLAVNAGLIGQIYTWLERSKSSFLKGRNISKRTEFLDAIVQTPVFDAAYISEKLQCTQRSARDYLNDAADLSIIKPIANRSHYKVWASYPIYDIFKDRLTTFEASKFKAFEQQLDTINKTDGQGDYEELDESKVEKNIDDIISDIDEVMKRSNLLLERLKLNRR